MNRDCRERSPFEHTLLDEALIASLKWIRAAPGSRTRYLGPYNEKCRRVEDSETL